MFMILLFINAFTTIRPAQVNKKTTYNTTLIRYTTKLLDTILLNQDKKLRPQSDDGSPLVVEIDILIRSMGPISEQNMEFSLDCYFRQKWLDKRLAFNQAYSSKPEIPLASKMLKDIWDLSVLKVYFKLQRQQGYYVLQIYTPCTLLVVMSWVSFWINKEASPARVALGIMTVLSMSTLGFGLRTDLPKVSHHTALDIYILSCFGFVFCAMIEYAVINYAQIVYIRKQIHDLQGLDSNAAMGNINIFTAGLISARKNTLQLDDDDVKLAEEKARLEALPWYKRIFFKNQNTSMFYRMAVKAAKARKKLRMRDPAKVELRLVKTSKKYSRS
ncbi:hypothetical protein WR25_20020 isoform B [Diploscapter pachys]|uniref:Neurotransmitter-gated ion-channel transmembrane domain-containing protein n=1 Tax=Diploscapter pachys TaxID=2018661 RepID=A0A2A2JU10_9BILA|nr:hypothetical protein WR25_20020 isoform B [Diploscapter pachys]